MRPVFVLVLALGLIVGACGSDGDHSATTQAGPATTSDTTEPASTPPGTAPGEREPPIWAAPISDYVGALFEAAGDGDVARLFPFFAENATMWVDTARADVHVIGGTRQLLANLESITVEAGPERGTPLLILQWSRPDTGPAEFWVDAIHTADYEGCPESGCRLIEMVSIGGRGDLIHILLRSVLVADLRTDPLGERTPSEAADLAPLLDRVEGQYFELAEAWSAHDVDGILGTDGGLEPSPGDRARVEATAEGLAAGFALWPESRMEPVTLADIGMRASTEPAVFFLADSDPFDLEDELGAAGVYRLHIDRDTSVLAGVRWTRRSGVIADLDLMFEMHSVDAVAADVGIELPDDPDAWPEVPQIERVATGSVATPGGDVITLYNARSSQRRLTEWAVDRYETAGLPVPTPRSIGFPPDLRCAVVAGRAVDTGAGVDLQLCVEAEEVCVGEGCQPSAVARSTMLHELGHVWTIENTDGDARRRFLEFRGLTVWFDPDTERDLLGTEHAAEILSWGLMDEPTWAARLPDGDCAVLAEAFEILTGLPPLRECPGA